MKCFFRQIPYNKIKTAVCVSGTFRLPIPNDSRKDIKNMTREEYDTKMAALEPMTDEQRKSMTCELLGHSHITTGCLWYIYCARCGEQVGDSLAGYYYDPLEVRVGHDCPTCHANYEKLDWESKILTPNPFTKDEEPDND